FVAHAVCRLPVGVDIAGRERRARLGVLVVTVLEKATARTNGRCRPIEVERRGRGRLHEVILVANDAALAVEARRLAQYGNRGALGAWRCGLRTNHDLARRLRGRGLRGGAW